MWGKKDRVINYYLKDRFLVSLIDPSGSAIEGLLIEVDEKTLNLSDCSLVTASKRTSVDGTVLIPRSNILYMQKP